jgi:hypothetical protein
MKLRAVIFAIVGFVASASAGLAGEMNLAAADGAVLFVDWQGPEQLPPRFRNHCTFENFTSRPYCSDHCGVEYQFYYCSPASFGCCHLGHGYCDWNGVLRCHP